MGLPLYLAMTGMEMAQCPSLPPHMGWFSPDCADDLPEILPPGALLILTDQIPFSVTEAWLQAVKNLDCGGVLLDFERPPSENTQALVSALAQALPCPVAAPPGYCDEIGCPVFLPPCPLHVPLADCLLPWREREIWLDMTAQQQTITVTGSGTTFGPVTPPDRQDGVWDEALCCRVITESGEDAVRFTLFDTADTLKMKLSRAEALGVAQAVGLWQELRKWA